MKQLKVSKDSAYDFFRCLILDMANYSGFWVTTEDSKPVIGYVTFDVNFKFGSYIFSSESGSMNYLKEINDSDEMIKWILPLNGKVVVNNRKKWSTTEITFVSEGEDLIKKYSRELFQ